MKNLHFALWGMVILLAAGLPVITSCSSGESDFEEQTVIEKDETEANKESPVTKDGPNGKPSEDIEPPDIEDPHDDDPPGDDDPLKPDLPDEGDDQTEPDEPEDEEIPDTLPKMVINELRTEYQGSTSRAEFIEFKMLSSGNLGGARVFIASNRQNALVYEFLPVKVKKGDYVVLHLRTLDEANVDEYGDDLSESGGRDASPDARDFWAQGNTKRLRKTDAVYVMDQDDNVLTAVMLAEEVMPARSAEFFFEAAEFLFSKGAWMSADGLLPGHEDAVNSANIRTALTRSISRDETVVNTNTAADWYITATGGVTPGWKNDPRRF